MVSVYSIESLLKNSAQIQAANQLWLKEYRNPTLANYVSNYLTNSSVAAFVADKKTNEVEIDDCEDRDCDTVTADPSSLNSVGTNSAGQYSSDSEQSAAEQNSTEDSASDEQNSDMFCPQEWLLYCYCAPKSYFKNISLLL